MSVRRRRFSWKSLRVAVQILAFLVVTAYFLSLVFPLRLPWPADALFQLDPSLEGAISLVMFTAGNADNDSSRHSNRPANG